MASDPGKGGPVDFGVKPLVDLYLHQSNAVDQLWTTYVIATFAGGTFALTAAENGGVAVLLAGAIGFSAFTLGHGALVWRTLTRMKLAGKDIAARLGSEPAPASLRHVAGPVNRWIGMTIHVVIDLCVLAAFAVEIAAARAKPPAAEALSALASLV
ncbi:MAG TPA: hypothetical protein VEA60_12880 [Allosphingosinicella sp.]|nr:hypothetical protein [Allosphingosinicella sp.]